MAQHKITADQLLALLVENADIDTGPDGKARLVIAAEPWLLDELAAHGADDCDGDNGDHEPNIVAPENAGEHFRQMDEADHDRTTVREWRAW